jgi:hypothetical protein
MPREKTTTGKRVVIAVRVSEAKAEAIDRARRGRTRADWLYDLINDALAHEGLAQIEQAVEETRQARQDMRARQERSDCAHPAARRQKGLCMACGKFVS